MTDSPGLVLITGASGGIGEALAHCAAADGHPLLLVARGEGGLNRVKGVIAAKHAVTVEVAAADLSGPGACAALARELAARGLVPEILINNAGYGLSGRAAKLPREDQLGMIDLNIRALTDLSLYYLPGMLAAGRGGILNLASTAAFMPGPNMAVYFASKAYVLSFGEALHEETRGSGVTVTTLCPGAVDTGFQARAGMKAIGATRVAGAMTAEAVAREGWAGFKSGARLIIPGTVNKLAAHGSRGMPRRFLLPAMRHVMASLRKS